jgi:DNA polymerase-1
MRTRAGLSTEAVYIFHNMVRKLVMGQKPDYIAAVFESAGPTFREQEFAAYKANRTEMPEDLGPQIPWIRKTLEAMRIPILEFPGFEADDVIGTLAAKAAAAGLEVIIVSSDKDMMQLVTNGVRMLNPMKPDPPKEFTLYDAKKVEEFLGVPPERVADLLALKGDSVDNIPGAPGIGDKGAKDLIAQFGSVEAALDRAAEVQRKTYRESLQNNRDQVLLSKRLATIDHSVPIEWSMEQVAAQPVDATALRDLYRELEFFSLLKELEPEPEALVQPIEFGDAGDVAALAEPVAVAVGERLGLAVEAGRGLRADLSETAKLRGKRIIIHDLKSVLDLAEEKSVFDTMLAGFLILAEPAAVSLDTLSERFLRRKPGPSVEEKAEATFCLAQALQPDLDEQGLRGVYDRIDLPLVPVLTRMESTGIRVDLGELSRLSTLMSAELDRLSADIFAIAGREFNINSPQQLGAVLFEEMKLPAGARSGKTKQASTAADVLEALAEEHEIARKVLDYRQVSKLKGTYADALPSLVRAETGRVHTTFNQTGAATGRLSSTNPNLQNIPIRTELGREIRAAFVPEPGWRLVVADYSQIELRLLAHMSRDATLVDAFVHGEDIHTRTASEVFGVAPLMVTPEMRRNAKAVNFGIVYGQTPFGLAQGLGIPRAEAELYIRSYFERYPGVRRWIDETIAKVRREGYAITLDGRRRPIPDMNSRNPNARGFAERTAVNTPLQGTAADLIKRAMIRIDGLLRGETWRSRMLLQVHDELVLEAPPEEAEALARMVKREMETVEKLAVPLIVDTGIGPNWRDAK